MTTDTLPPVARPPDQRAHLFFVLLSWLAVVASVLLGMVFLAAATGPCGGKGLLSGLGLLGFFLMGFAAWVGVRSRGPRATRTACLGSALVLGVFFVVPDLMRPRISQNEFVLLGDMRILVAAEAAYARANAGFFDGDLTCLRRPAQCIPGYRANTASILPEELLSTRCGYVRTLHLGPAASHLPVTASRSSVTSYAYSASPVEPGRSGVRGFCADSSGTFCFTLDGTAPSVRPDGMCDLSKCTKLE